MLKTLEIQGFSLLLFLINASIVEEFLYREILWNLVSKLDIHNECICCQIWTHGVL